MPPSRRARRRPPPACRRSPTIPGSPSMPSTATPASTRRAGPGRTRTSPRRCARVEDKLQALGATDAGAAQGPFRRRAGAGLPRRRLRPLPRRGPRLAGLSAARPERLRLRSDVRPDGHDRTFGEMPAERKQRHVASRPRLRELRRGETAEMSGEPGFGVYVHWPFCAAKCPYCDFNSHVRHTPPDQARYRRRLRPRDRDHRRSRPGPHRVEHLPRRRHAVADGAGDGRRHPRRGRRALDGGARCRGHARGQPLERRGRALPRLSRGRRQPRLARRPGAQRRRPPHARPPARCRRPPGRRSRSRGRPSRASPST